VRRILPLRALAVCTALLAIAVVAWSAPVCAQSSEAPKPTRTAAFQRAVDAWNEKAFDLVPGLFQDALDAGGLDKAAVVDAYARIGAASAILHGTHAGLPAFRKAALLDPEFKLPPEAGKKALALAEQARREQAHFGSLGVTVEAADEVGAAASIPVDVSLTLPRNPLVDTVSVEARDPLTAHVWTQARAPAEGLHFEIPARMTLPDASIVVSVEVRDVHKNQLATVEKRVHVAAPPPAPAAPPPPPAPPLLIVATEPRGQNHDETSPVHPNKGGFWSSAWPWVFGVAALAAGGAVAYYTLRPTDQVTVSGAHVNVVP
jgi:hypothetical protein